MDAMALLCTLHADGPTTLKRLREAGCDSIEAVGRLDPDAVAKLLSTTPAAARRFLREAAHLSLRLDTGFLEREEKALEVPSTEPSAARSPADLAPASKAPAVPVSSARENHPSLGYRDQRIVQEVLEAWRKHDSEGSSPAGAPSARAAPDARPRAAHDSGAADDGIAEAARAVHPEEGRGDAEVLSRSKAGGDVARDASRDASPNASKSALQPGLEGSHSTDILPGAVDGLDQETCLRLRQAGIDDLEMLARVDPLALSKTLGVGYMRLTRLCALARRKLAHASAFQPAHSSARGHQTARSPSTSESAAHASSEIKFSRAGNPLIGVLPALAQDLEVHVGPKPLLPSRTRWSPTSATSTEGEESGGPFA